MGLIRLLFWLALGALVVVALKRIGRASGGQSRPRPPGGAAPEEMVRCVACGLNVPKSEAVPCTGGWACSVAHARGAGPSARA